MPLHPTSEAIFSPSVARIAASTAKDWKYVDDWLASKFRGRKPPSLERNPDTLKALLALAALNETADEERRLIARAESAALRELQASGVQGSDGEPSLKSEILTTLEDSLSDDGHAALDALSSLSVELGDALPTPASLGQELINLQTREFDLHEMQARVQVLQSYTELEMDQANHSIDILRSWRYAPSSDLSRQNLDLQRKIKSMSAKLPELEEHLTSMTSAGVASGHGNASHPTIDQIAEQEAVFLATMAKKRDLEAQVAEFAGLPDNTDAARGQLEELRSELRSLTRKRDAVFEGLVEQATPRKRP